MSTLDDGEPATKCHYRYILGEHLKMINILFCIVMHGTASSTTKMLSMGSVRSFHYYSLFLLNVYITEILLTRYQHSILRLH